MIWPIMHHNMLRLLQNIGEKFSLLWFTTPDNTSNQGAEGAAGPDHRLLLLRESYWRKIETWNFLRRCPGHQPRGWKHNEAPRTWSHGALTILVWVRIDSCRNQEGSDKPSWTSSRHIASMKTTPSLHHKPAARFYYYFIYTSRSSQL